MADVQYASDGSDRMAWEAVHQAKPWGTCPEPAVARFAMRRFGDRLQPGRGARLPHALDIGTGSGAQAVWLAQIGFVVDACDISESAIARAKAWADHVRLASIRFRRADVRSLPFPDATYDAVIDVGCLQHVVDDRYKASMEIGRVLKPGGWLLSIHASLDHSVAAFGGLPASQASQGDMGTLFRPWCSDLIVDRSFYSDSGWTIAHLIVQARRKE
jgi:ubiquinone/menaquinone biosynthesis C-methylase UbiE